MVNIKLAKDVFFQAATADGLLVIKGEKDSIVGVPDHIAPFFEKEGYGEKARSSK